MAKPGILEDKCRKKISVGRKATRLILLKSLSFYSFLEDLAITIDFQNVEPTRTEKN
jgi:hypothetical protein